MIWRNKWQAVPLNETLVPVRGDERADGDGSLQPLFHIQVTGRLVKHKTAETEKTVMSLRLRSEFKS